MLNTQVVNEPHSAETSRSVKSAGNEHQPSPTKPGSLREFRLYQPKAGHPDWPVLAAEARELAQMLRGNLEPPEKRWRKVRRMVGAYKTAAQNFRTNRRLSKMGREDLRPLYFIWSVLRNCNFRCTYCDDHQGRKYPELPIRGALTTEQGLSLLKIMRTRTPAVYFAGGEPTIRKDLPILTRAARDLSYYPIIINTNGSLVHRLLQKEAWRTWLADTDMVIVSLDGLDLEKLRRLWVTKRPEDVVRNLLLLRELSSEMGFKLIINTVIVPDQIDSARDVLNFANDLGLYFTPVPMNVGPRVEGSLPKSQEYRRLVDTILARKREGHRITGSSRLNRRLLRSEALNCRNTLKPHVDYDGRLIWPCKASINVKPEGINVLDFDSVDELYEHACRRIEPTRFHGPAANQCGAQCNWAQNYTTDAYANGLEHPLSLIGEVFEFVTAR